MEDSNKGECLTLLILASQPSNPPALNSIVEWKILSNTTHETVDKVEIGTN